MQEFRNLIVLGPLIYALHHFEEHIIFNFILVLTGEPVMYTDCSHVTLLEFPLPTGIANAIG